MPGSVNYQCGGTVGTSRFVSPNLAGPYNGIDFQVVNANGSQPIVGISQPGTKVPPGTPGFDDNIAGTSGDIIAVFQDEANDEPLLRIAGTVTGGMYLKADTNGFGVQFNPNSTTAQYIGAEARQSGVSGDLIRVRPRISPVGRMT